MVSPELLGDVNADGHVDLNDLNIVLNNLGTANSAWTSGNFDGAATIDLTDLNDVLNNLGVTSTIGANTAELLPAFVYAADTPAPEPASLALLAGGAAPQARGGNAPRILSWVIVRCSMALLR